MVYNAQNHDDPDALDLEIVNDKEFDELQRLKKSLPTAKDPRKITALKYKIKAIQVTRTRD